MRGRLLVAAFIGAVLARPVGAQVSPVPPPASRVTQTGANEVNVAPVLGAEAPPANWATMPPAVPRPQLPPPIPPPSWEGQSWVTVESLLWWIEGSRVPALLSTSPAGTPLGQAGVLGGKNDSTVLFGLGNVNSNLTAGANIKAGTWLDPNHKYGVEVNFFLTSPQGTSFGAASPNGNPILARPFIDPTTGNNSSSVLALPGFASGAFYGSYSTSGILGTGILFRENIANSRDPFCMCRFCGGCDSCAGCGTDAKDGLGFRIDSLLGYRFLRLEDHLDALSSTTSAAGLTRTTDQIRAMNNFNGVDLGFNGEFRRGGWYLDTLVKAAFGITTNAVHMYGAHTLNGVLEPGGGFLVQPSNFGQFNKSTGTIIPQLGFNLGYRFNDQLRAYAGYTLFYWFHVARSGDALDTSLSSSGVVTGTNPAYGSHDNNIWVQGINIGLEWRY
jgi:hypothetical protein